MDTSSKSKRNRRLRSVAFAVIVSCAVPALTGCQVDIGGQTLPSAHYLDDDVQYFPPGPEFMLANEAAAMDQYNRGQRNGQP